MGTGTVIDTMNGGSFIKVRSGSIVSTVEMIGDEGELQVGDKVRGNWTSLGGETIWPGPESFDVFIQDYA
jgi:hypothetical protein